MVTCLIYERWCDYGGRLYEWQPPDFKPCMTRKFLRDPWDLNLGEKSFWYNQSLIKHECKNVIFPGGLPDKEQPSRVCVYVFSRRLNHYPVL